MLLGRRAPTVLRGWNATAPADPARDVAGAVRGSRRAARPDAAALVFDDAARSATRAGRARQPAGAPPASRAASGPRPWSGLLLERSLEMVIGAARHAQGRRRPICRSTRTTRAERLALHARPTPARAGAADAGGTAAHRLPATARRMLPRCRLARRSRGSPTPRAAGRCGRTQPAYVIYTSGSTGRPKGVVGPHSRGDVSWSHGRGFVRMRSGRPGRAVAAVALRRLDFELCGAAAARRGADRLRHDERSSRDAC